MNKRWLIAGVVVLASLTACVSGCLFGNKQSAPLVDIKSQPPRIGDLGGMKVSIPSYMAQLLEYEGDPGWDWKAAKTFKTPVRTYESKIISFGFHVRYPDMATESTFELAMEQHKSKPDESMWLDVGITSGSHYGSTGLNGLAKYIQTPKEQYPYSNYEKLPSEEVFGLTLYALKGINPKTGRLYRDDDSTEEVYLYQEQGKTIAYIRCLHKSLMYSSCEQHFDMGDKYGVRVWGRILYKRDLLKHWRDIQSKVETVVLGFKAQ